MKDLDKKSNKELHELKLKLQEDYEIIRRELLMKHDHWEMVRKTYVDVYNELKKRNAL